MLQPAPRPYRLLALDLDGALLSSYVRTWSAKTEIAADRFVAWIGVARGKFFEWKKRYGKANEHNALVPRDHWLLDEESGPSLAFYDRYPLEATVG